MPTGRRIHSEPVTDDGLGRVKHERSRLKTCYPPLPAEAKANLYQEREMLATVNQLRPGNDEVFFSEPCQAAQGKPAPDDKPSSGKRTESKGDKERRPGHNNKPN